jgi:tetratricopeptide (TPR) repeat protein
MSEDTTKRVLLRNFRAALQRRDGAGAADVFARLQELDPLGLVTRGCEVELALASDRVAEARALADTLVQLHPASPRAHWLAGRVAYRQRDWSAAALHFRESDLLHGSDRCKHMLGKALCNTPALDEAEAILVALQPRIEGVALDLAWLDERRGDLARALDRVEAFLRRRPDDPRALDARTRLQARRLDPVEVQEEVEGLEALGEAIDADTLARFAEVALAQGDAQRVRDLVAPRLPSLSPRDAQRLGWVAYKAMAWDLAADLMLRALPERATDPRFLNALQTAARNGGRLPELREAYDALAPRFKPLYGRLRKLFGAS